MSTTPRRITNTTGTIPQSTTISGAVTVSADRNNTLTYTGAINLKDYITDGNSGGSMSYVYLVCEDATTIISKVTGCVQLTEDTITPANNTWSIFTDGDMTSASSSAFSLITTPFYGYSYLNDGSATVTVDGINIIQGEGNAIDAPDYADGLNIGNTLKPLYVNATGSDVLITNEVLGAPSI